MVAGTIATMDKSGPAIFTAQQVPEVGVERSKSTRRYVLLTSWASVATSVLLVVLITGAVYINEIKSNQCPNAEGTGAVGNSTKDYSRKFIQEDGSEDNEDIHVDLDDQSEVISTKGPNGNIDLIYALNYRTKISATYIPSANECFLLAGDEIEQLDNWGLEKDKTEQVAKKDLFEQDYKSSGNKVTDLSILPRAIKPFCEGKDCFWAELVEGDDEGVDGEQDVDSETGSEDGVRQKRSFTCCSYSDCYTYRCGLWRKCRRCIRSRCCGSNCSC